MKHVPAMMDLDAFNAFCASFRSATTVVQWRGAHVWKVGAKVFAIAGKGQGDGPWVTFKVSPLAYEILKDQDGLRPAPYLASRGMKWIQRTGDGAMDDRDLKRYIGESYRLVALGLTRKARRELGIEVEGEAGK